MSTKLGRLKSHGTDAKRLYALEAYTNKLKDYVDEVHGSDSIPIYASAYGVKGDGGDYTAELQAALDAAYDLPRRTTVMLPIGDILISDTIKVPHQVIMRGVNRSSTFITVSPTFPLGGVMVQLGKGTLFYQEGNMVTDLTLVGFDEVTQLARADVGLHLWRVNEHSGAERVWVLRCKRIGILTGYIPTLYEGDVIDGAVALNFILRDLWVLIRSDAGWGGDTDSKAIHIARNSAESIFIDNVTTNAGAGAGSAGIYHDASGNCTLRVTNSHLEVAEVGLYVKNAVWVSGNNLTGHSSLQHLVAIGTTSKFHFSGLIKNGTTTSSITIGFDQPLANQIQIVDNVLSTIDNFVHIDNKGNYIQLHPRFDQNMRVFEKEAGKLRMYEFWDSNGEAQYGILRRKYSDTPPASQLDGFAIIPGYVVNTELDPAQTGAPTGQYSAEHRGLIYIEDDVSPKKVWFAAGRGSTNWVDIS